MLSSAKLVLTSVFLLAFSASTLANHHGEKKDIVDIAAGDDQFSTLVTALEAADLVDTLKGDGPFTVFAPTNEAFEALPAGTLTDLLKPENKATLQAVLTYHVLAQKVMSEDIAGTTASPETVQGDTVAIDATDGVTVGGATVVKADIKASNGVIHVIDSVLLPPQE